MATISDEMFAYSPDVLDDYIKTLNEFALGKEQKNIADMTNDELLAYMAKLKEIKK